jgi:Asp-tRNA(Asn)/Glu-tRNA(Gln) amidotransferase A subunit family amidase
MSSSYYRGRRSSLLSYLAVVSVAFVMTVSHGQEGGELVAKVEAALQRISDGAELNAFITVDAQGAREQARRLDAGDDNQPGPLRGMTITVKDNIEVAGLPITGGTPTLREFIATDDAEAIRLLREAGVIILGKANMHELAIGITSNNAAFGAVGNAHNPAYIPGGSSGGTATAIAAGFVDAGLGTDTGGSSRIPAALNGIVGLRPTTGRYSGEGVIKISPTRDTIGPMAPTVAVTALLDTVLAGENAGELVATDLDGLRIGVPRGYFYDNLDPPVAAAMDDVLEALAQAGAVLVEADLVNVPELSGKVGFPIVLYETARVVPAWLEAKQTGITLEELYEGIASPDVKAIMGSVINEPVPEEAYIVALETDRPALQKAYADYFETHNVEAVIFPTTPLVARPIADSDEVVMVNGEEIPTFAAYIRNTDPGSNAGIPGLSIPAGESPDGLPVGVEIDGPADSDRRLLAIGLAIEKLVAGH